MLLRARFTFWLTHNRLIELEKELAICAYDLMKVDKSAFSVAQLQLATKAVASFRTSLLLGRQNLHQEADALYRIFVESWMYLMDFTWHIENGIVLEWFKNHDRPLNEKTSQVRQRVQAAFAKRLGLGPRQNPSLVRMFDDLSNNAIHPTRSSAQKAWALAAERGGIGYAGENSAESRTLRNNTVWMNYMRYFMHLGWFLRFLRVYVFSLPPINLHFPKRTLLENVLEKWIGLAPSKIQAFVDDVERQYIAQKRAERAAKKQEAEITK
jgi:hypothetical protein